MCISWRTNWQADSTLCSPWLHLPVMRVWVPHVCQHLCTGIFGVPVPPELCCWLCCHWPCSWQKRQPGDERQSQIKTCMSMAQLPDKGTAACSQGYTRIDVAYLLLSEACSSGSCNDVGIIHLYFPASRCIYLWTHLACATPSISVPLQSGLKLTLALLPGVYLHLCSDQTGREAELTLLDVWSVGQEAQSCNEFDVVMCLKPVYGLHVCTTSDIVVSVQPCLNLWGMYLSDSEKNKVSFEVY